MLKKVIGACFSTYRFFFTEDRFFNRKKICNFYPSCSEYAQESIVRFGFWRGSQLSFIRILKCNPFSGFSIDVVKTKNHD